MIRAVCMALIFMTFALTAHGGDTVVEVLGNNTFSPREVTIQVGDTVRWEWRGGSHTVTSGTGAGDPDAARFFDEPSTREEPEFSFTFPRAGVFPYFCRPHEIFDMRGTVTVVPEGSRSILAVVQTAEGTPVSCAAVIARGDTIDRVAVVDNSGQADFDGLSDFASGFVLTVSAPEFELSGGPVTIGAADFDANGLAGATLIVAPTNETLQTVVRGQVTDMRNNSAIPGARVETMVDDTSLDPPVVAYTCADGSYEVPRVNGGGGFVSLEYRAANFETLVVDQSPIGESLNVGLTPSVSFGGPAGCSTMMLTHHWNMRAPWVDWMMIALVFPLLAIVRHFTRRSKNEPVPGVRV